MSVKTRTVVRGSDSGGDTVVLEAVEAHESPEQRLAYWKTPFLAHPFDHDVHLAIEIVTTVYLRTEED